MKIKLNDVVEVRSLATTNNGVKGITMGNYAGMQGVVVSVYNNSVWIKVQGGLIAMRHHRLTLLRRAAEC